MGPCPWGTLLGTFCGPAGVHRHGRLPPRLATPAWLLRLGSSLAFCSKEQLHLPLLTRDLSVHPPVPALFCGSCPTLCCSLWGLGLATSPWAVPLEHLLACAPS